jgi:hypothetical protein
MVAVGAVAAVGAVGAVDADGQLVGTDLTLTEESNR